MLKYCVIFELNLKRWKIAIIIFRVGRNCGPNCETLVQRRASYVKVTSINYFLRLRKIYDSTIYSCKFHFYYDIILSVWSFFVGDALNVTGYHLNREVVIVLACHNTLPWWISSYEWPSVRYFSQWLRANWMRLRATDTLFLNTVFVYSFVKLFRIRDIEDSNINLHSEPRTQIPYSIFIRNVQTRFYL